MSFWKCTGVPCNCEWLFTIGKIYELNEARDVIYSDSGISFNGGFKPNIIELLTREGYSFVKDEERREK